jgi:glucose-1-phosphate adenylyltransferase
MKKECIAMLLAGGQGKRLGSLTSQIAKPAVSFGGKYRIIDFTLSNCVNSNIDTIGVMTQYCPMLLNSYIGTGAAWDLDVPDGGVSVLPPYATSSSVAWYRGTADAVYRNMNYIDHYDPEYVLILSGDHLYRMDYSRMLAEHKKEKADLSIAVFEVPIKEASRFGIMSVDDNSYITKFSEKPAHPESNLASMGIYSANESSSHDFGKDIIPKLLNNGNKLYAYRFDGYWKDIGTSESYYEASMDLLSPNSEFELFNVNKPRVLSNVINHSPEYIGSTAEVKDCIVCPGSIIYGKVEHSIISSNARIEEGAVVKDSIILPDAKIGRNARVEHAIIGEGVVIGDQVSFGSGSGELQIAGENLMFENADGGER